LDPALSKGISFADPHHALLGLFFPWNSQLSGLCLSFYLQKEELLEIYSGFSLLIADATRSGQVSESLPLYASSAA